MRARRERAKERFGMNWKRKRGSDSDSDDAVFFFFSISFFASFFFNLKKGDSVFSRAFCLFIRSFSIYTFFCIYEGKYVVYES